MAGTARHALTPRRVLIISVDFTRFLCRHDVHQRPPSEVSADTCISIQNTISYGNYEAVKNVYCDIPRGQVTAFIGPSGCGKSTVLRALNRMNDLIENCLLKGRVLFDGVDLYAPNVDPVEVRRRIGMVFQQPNPFPKSIYENIAFGARINGYSGDMDELVERSLRQAAVWDECKDKLNERAIPCRAVNNSVSALLGPSPFSRRSS